MEEKETVDTSSTSSLSLSYKRNVNVGQFLVSRVANFHELQDVPI